MRVSVHHLLALVLLLQPAFAFGQDAGEDAGLEPDAGLESLVQSNESDEATEGTAELSDEVPLADECADPDAGFRYTNDLSDAELARLWKEEPTALGSVSLGRPEEGRMINAIPFPDALDGGAWTVIIPESCWTTQETADAVIGAANELRAQFPDGPPVRVGQVSAKEGGYMAPHLTHQNGRDVDIGLFYPGPEPYRIKEREKVMDVAMNWAFVKALLTHGDVQYILLDWRVQNVLYAYALKSGENRAWLDSLFKAGKASVFHHARKHRDHFHVRYWNARAQELAHRLAPLLPVRPDENIAFHRVKKGDTLGGIASRYGSSVSKLKSGNRLESTFLRVGQVLRVALRGPCTNCPVPPLVKVPPRRVPPARPQG